MPKRRKKNKKKGKKSGGIPRSVGSSDRKFDPTERTRKETFRVAPTAISASITGGTITVTEFDAYFVNTFMGARGMAFADLFQLYRIVGFRVKGFAHCASSGTANPGNTSWYIAVAFAPSSTYTAPATIGAFCDFPHMVWCADFSPNSLSLRIGRRELLSRMAFKWMKTVSTGSTDPEYKQFCMTVVSQPSNSVTIASVLDLIMEIDVEFASPIDPNLLPRKVPNPTNPYTHVFSGSAPPSPFEEFKE